MSNQTKVTSPKTTNPAELFSLVRGRIDELDYVPIYKKQLFRVLKRFQEYVELHDVAEYSVRVGEDFLTEAFETGESVAFQLRMHCVVDMVNQMFLHGVFHKRYVSRHFSWPESMAGIYEAYCKEREKTLAEKSARNMRRNTQEIASFLQSQGVMEPAQITVQMIEKYALTLGRFEAGAARARATELKYFCQHLLKKDLIHEKVLHAIPYVKIMSHDKIPIAFSHDEISALLGAVDRANAIGKRDYAILLLAVTTGLRAGDLQNLKFKDIRWDKNAIELTQQKTGVPLTLPLVNDAGKALIDYIKNGRPICDCSHIFIRHIQPYDKMSTMGHLIKEYMLAAGIRLKHGSAYGVHTLRRSLASLLLEKNVPYPVIAETLGHVLNSDATMRYMMIDLQRLKQCALEVPALD